MPSTNRPPMVRGLRQSKSSGVVALTTSGVTVLSAVKGVGRKLDPEGSTVTNYSVSSSTFDVLLVPDGVTPAESHTIMADVTIASKATVDLPGWEIPADYFLWMSSGANDACNALVSYDEDWRK